MKTTKAWSTIAVQGLFVLYVYVLCKIILFKFHSFDAAFLWEQLKLSLGNPHLVSRRLHDGNMTPFREISRSIHYLSGQNLINLIGNVAIFMPCGFLLGLMSADKRISFISAFAGSFGLSLCLECAQALFAIGKFDVDDLILNTGGGLLGFVGFHLFVKFMAAASHAFRAGDKPA